MLEEAKEYDQINLGYFILWRKTQEKHVCAFTY